MTIKNMVNKNLPDYYNTMYLDGFSPMEIYSAAKKTMYENAQRRREEQEDEDTFNIHITSEVKTKR